ncbi:MAG: zinc ABC transporter ATP-binding protein ZnuC [Thiomargarita sp.]|nr:zinc ABC transporter ATP-binding protein ZnuC [Thiomargarita sp.]
MQSNYLVRVKNISVQFQYNIVLENVSLDVQQNKIITLIGPNGAGKSTLVKIVLGLIMPNSGKILRQKNIIIGYMPQHLHINPILPLTVERFLTLGDIKKDKIKSILDEVGASKILKTPLQHVSGGEMQRVLLARALLREPDLLVLDEPIQGVDVAGQYELYDLINHINQEKQCGILMVSHDLHIVMATTDYVICLNKKICCSGHPTTVSQHPDYLALFGSKAAQDLAIYTHHHYQNNQQISA